MRSIRLRWAAALLATLVAGPATAQLVAEELGTVELKDRMQPHWVWLNDVAFTHISDGRAYLIDGDSGAFLGMISGGMAHGSIQIAPDGASFAVPATFLSRGSRGERTDVVTFYDTKTLTPGAEVVIPPKRMLALPSLSAMPTTDDGRFSIVYNFTPEQSVTIVDLAARKLVGEFATSGCALAYPTGNRSFFMQCGDGSLQGATLDESGKVTLRGASPKIFADNDPANEKPVRIGQAQWLFFTYGSQAHLIDAGGRVPVEKQAWSLLGPGDEGWRIGGVQSAAYHKGTRRLYTLMHEGGRFTQEYPGTEIWVYDMATRKRIARHKLPSPASAIAISEDGDPLLYAVMFGAPELRVIAPDTGATLRMIGDLSRELTIIQPAPAAAGAIAGKAR